MNAIVQFLLKHGYSVLFASVFARQMCLPVPAILFLLAAGALAGSGKLSLVAALGVAVPACVLADLVWYEAGRRWGDGILHFLHGLAIDPDAADRNVEEKLCPVRASGSRGGKIRSGTGRGSASSSRDVRHKPASFHGL